LMGLAGAVEVFAEKEKGLAFQTPFGHTDHPTSL
jgi:hypothetical protein